MSKWADYLISAVRYDSSQEKIEFVKTHEDKGNNLGTEQKESLAKVVSNIEKGYTYCTITKSKDNEWNKGENVHVVVVDGSKYIRTDNNNTEKDNLENLPKFQ
ncbi:MAG: DUF3892 domain-containing protein [Candidatus Tenebribacter davisii]|nr:DUF3892 domain-containing protein [Candidatus Tenebribacter davisii]